VSLTQLKDQAAHLQSAEQRELIAFLVALQTEKDEEFKRTLARKIDDANPSRWIELPELQKRYSD
jgi:spore coat protein CotH